ncbi:MAG: hypothetical protein JW797_15630 [Bradymonadales bacterium]|nr:hypothetical protein [Bradymonadales bacterium]
MNREIPLQIPLDDVTLEARLAPGGGDARTLWLIGHPHPLYGGSMDNDVVLAVQQAVLTHGDAALRWNSRGVGRSTGRHGHGLTEAEDVLGLLDLFARGAGTPLDLGAGLNLSLPVHAVGLAGYSFGAWVALRALALGARPPSVMLVSPPLDFMAPDGLDPPSVPCLITLGDRDELCSQATLHRWLSGRREDPGLMVRIIRGADHFYSGRQPALVETVRDFLVYPL